MLIKEYVDTVRYCKIGRKYYPKVLEELDPHSIYIPAIDLQAMNEPLEGILMVLEYNLIFKKILFRSLKLSKGDP